MKKYCRSHDLAASNCARWTAALWLLPIVIACRSTPTGPSPISGPESWHCRNDLEISCDRGKCAVADTHTPMDVAVDDAGSMRVCAYSGCWEGVGAVTRSKDYIVLVGDDLVFSTAPDSPDRRQDILVAIDRTDGIGLLKAGEFAHPLVCQGR